MTATFDSNVDVTVECAFGYDPYDTPVWTDVTQYVRQFDISRGRSRVLEKVKAGQATVVFDNNDSRFTPENTSGPYSPNVRVMTPIRIQAVHNAVTYDLFRGFVEAWPLVVAVQTDNVVPAKCIDAFRLLASFEDDWTEAADRSGNRIDAILDTVGWPAGWRDIDVGQHFVLALLAGDFNTALGEIQRAELVEQGLFWIAGNGDATFRDSYTRLDTTSISATFSDDGSDVGYADLQLNYDDVQMWNAATVTREGGEEQVATGSAASQGDYGKRNMHLSGTAHRTDGEARALADWIVAEYKDVRLRASRVVLKPQEDPSVIWPQALGLEFWDRVNVERTGPSSSTVDKDCFVEGVDHHVTMVGRRAWVTTFSLSPDIAHNDWWVVGTSELGTDTRLGY